MLARMARGGVAVARWNGCWRSSGVGRGSDAARPVAHPGQGRPHRHRRQHHRRAVPASTAGSKRVIQTRFPGSSSTFRNLGFSGDEVATRLRSKNFGTPDEWLSANPAPIGGYTENRFAGIETKADVIFAFFGYNESYAGEAGLRGVSRRSCARG